MCIIPAGERNRRFDEVNPFAFQINFASHTIGIVWEAKNKNPLLFTYKTDGKN